VLAFGLRPSTLKPPHPREVSSCEFEKATGLVWTDEIISRATYERGEQAAITNMLCEFAFHALDLVEPQWTVTV